MNYKMAEKNELSFEKAIGQLEELVDKMESGQLPLEKAMEAFEKGTELVKRCEELLAGYEQKITVLKREGSTVEEAAFDLKEEL